MKNYSIPLLGFSHKSFLQILIVLVLAFLVGGVLIFNPFNAAALFGLSAILLVTLAIFKHPPAGLYLIILAIPFDSHFLSLGPVNLSASNALIVITSLAWLLAHFFSKTSLIKDLNYLLIAWIMLAALTSTLVAIDIDAHVRQLVTLIGCGLTYFLTVNLIKDIKTLNRALFSLGLAILMAATIAIIQVIGFLFWGVTLGIGRILLNVGQDTLLLWPRVTSIFEDPNFFGYFLLILLPAMFYDAVSRKMTKLQRALKLSLLVLPFSGLIASYSRGAWLGMSLSLIAVFFLLLRRHISKISGPVIFTGIMLVALSLGIALFDLIRSPVDFIFDLNPESVLYRFEIWGLAINTYLMSPFWGVGFSGIVAEYDSDTHNTLLHLITSLGFFGFLPFLILLLKTLKTGASNLNTHIGRAMFASLIGAFTATMFIDVFFIKSLWLLIGLINIAAKIDYKKEISE